MERGGRGHGQGLEGHRHRQEEGHASIHEGTQKNCIKLRKNEPSRQSLDHHHDGGGAKTGICGGGAGPQGPEVPPGTTYAVNAAPRNPSRRNPPKQAGRAPLVRFGNPTRTILFCESRPVRATPRGRGGVEGGRRGQCAGEKGSGTSALAPPPRAPLPDVSGEAL